MRGRPLLQPVDARGADEGQPAVDRDRQELTRVTVETGSIEQALMQRAEFGGDDALNHGIARHGAAVGGKHGAHVDEEVVEVPSSPGGDLLGQWQRRVELAGLQEPIADPPEEVLTRSRDDRRPSPKSGLRANIPAIALDQVRTSSRQQRAARQHDSSLYVKRPDRDSRPRTTRSIGSAPKLRPVPGHQMSDQAIGTVPPKPTRGRREATSELSAPNTARDIGIFSVAEVRHEAPCSRVEVRDLRRRAVAAVW
jgi:hypothetical protein